MKLKKLTITNFRGIAYAQIDLEDFTTLVGPNNIGKSTILNAINIVLDNKKPTPKDWPADNLDSEEMEIECIFNGLHEWEVNKPALSGLIHENLLKIKMKATRDITDNTTAEYGYYVYHDKDTYPWTDKTYTEAKKDEISSQIFSAVGITKALDYKNNIELAEKFSKKNHPGIISSDTDWHQKKFAQSLQQAVPHVMYVPATFKIEDDLKTSNTTPFSFLFSKGLFPKVKNHPSYAHYITHAENLERALNSKEDDGIIDLQASLETLSNSLNKVLDFDSHVKLAFGNIDIEQMFFKAATLMIDEGFEISLDNQGSGVQRALAYAILESNAAVEAQVTDNARTVVVLYEEPELYIHPHLMRRLKKTLQTQSQSPSWQVICSTHSPFLVDIANNPESLKLLKRDSNNSRVVHQITEEIFEVNDKYNERTKLRAALDFHPTVCESLFGKRVVIVEGDTELAVFSMIDELVSKFNISGSQHADTTVVSAAGKWTIPALARVLTGLDIEYKIIHDTDRKGKTDSELETAHHIHPFKANKKISSIAGKDNVFLVEDTFENVLWTNEELPKVPSNDKPFRSWERIRGFIDDTVELQDSSQSTLKEIIEFAFT